VTTAGDEQPAVRLRDARAARRAADEQGFEIWLQRAAERTDPFMAWLGVLFALLVGFQLVAQVRPPMGRALDAAGWLIWSVFVLDFGVKLLLAPDRPVFLRRHWLQLLGLLLPTLRLLSFVRLLRIGRALPAARVLTTSYRTAGTARHLLRSRLAYLGGLATVMTVALAELAYLFEHRAGGTIGSFGDALVWAAGLVLAMQADPIPTSRPGQLVMLAGFAAGLVVVATLAGSLGAFLLEGRAERTDDAAP
jgi:voltage-gated potassium channel